MAGARLADIHYVNIEVAQYLAALESQVDDMAPVYRDIGEYLLPATQDRFLDQESPEGEAWAPLKPEYKLRKKKNADRILVLEGYMRDLLSYQATSDKLELGSGLIQAATHQFGDRSRGIPDRPYLGVSEDDRQQILQILHQHLLLINQ